MLKIVEDPAMPNSAGGSLLDEIVRDGARQMLAAALLAEVAAYTEAHREVLDVQGHRLVIRNGYHAQREVATAAGAVPVRAPRVNDKRIDETTGQQNRVLLGRVPNGKHRERLMSGEEPVRLTGPSSRARAAIGPRRTGPARLRPRRRGWATPQDHWDNSGSDLSNHQNLWMVLGRVT